MGLRQNKIRNGFECFGCGAFFKRRRELVKHQGFFWPGCPDSQSSLFDEVETSTLNKK